MKKRKPHPNLESCLAILTELQHVLLSSGSVYPALFMHAFTPPIRDTKLVRRLLEADIAIDNLIGELSRTIDMKGENL